MRLVFFLVFSFFALSSYSQNITGKVLEKESQKPISFASVYYKFKNIGTYSESDGSFTISIVPNDTLIISALGYDNIEIPSSDIKNASIFSLTSVTYRLEDVLIQQTSTSVIGNKKLVLGNASNRKNTLMAGIKGRTVAFLIAPNDRSLGYISALTFGISSLTEALIKVHVFKIDEETGMPGEPMLLSNNVVKIKKGQRKIKHKLGDRKILMPLEGVFVALEWIGDVAQNESKLVNPFYTGSRSKVNVPTFSRFMGKDWQEQLMSSVVPSKKSSRKRSEEVYFLKPNFNLTLRY